jgi:hypothetical protein
MIICGAPVFGRSGQESSGLMFVIYEEAQTERQEGQFQTRQH